MANIEDKIYNILNGKQITEHKSDITVGDAYDYIIECGQKGGSKATTIGKLIYQAGYGKHFVETGGDIIIDLANIPEDIIKNIYEIIVPKK